jgi:putative ABC transport system permease protein
MLARDKRAEGVNADEARFAARRQLGNMTKAREDARAQWGFRWLDIFEQDLRYTLRGIRRNPGFAIAVALTLGLGIGANSAMFGVIDQMMFRPLPYLRDPVRVHRVYLRWHERDHDVTNDQMEYTRYLDLKRWTHSFSDYAAFASRTLAVGVGDEAQERRVALVSAGFFDFFDARPAAGRFFVSSEDATPRGASVAVLGYDFWIARYAGRPDAVGASVLVENILCQIVGVAPRGFMGVDDERAPAVYMPITTLAGANQAEPSNYYTRYDWSWMRMMVRRRPEVTVESASADLSNAFLQSWNAQRTFEPLRASPNVARPRAIASGIKPASGPEPSLEARTALWVTAVAGIVLAIACANVVNLFLARALRRRREIAVRLALGVSRGRLVSQFLTESVVLALLGGAVGVLIAQWGGAAMRALFLPGADAPNAIGDWRTLWFSFLAALIAGVLTGLAPALVGVRGDLGTSLKAGTREGTSARSRTRASLLVFQGALSVVLLVGAGLFVRSLDRVRSLKLGYDAGPVLLLSTNLRGMAVSDSGMLRLGAELVQAAKAIPGVEYAAWTSSVPLTDDNSLTFFVPGIDSVRKLGRFTYTSTSPDYFKVMDTRIIRGRAFDDRDRSGAPRVVVVSAAMAKMLWPGKDAIGQCMHRKSWDSPCTTIIGIAENANQGSLSSDNGLHYYLPIDQDYRSAGRALLLRPRDDPALVGESIRRQLQGVMPGQAYLTAEPLRDVVASQRRSWLLGATMFVAFGALALVVAGLGLYSVIAYSVAQRSHELAVRVALGAQARDLTRLVVGDGVRVAVVGVAIGGAIAFALAGKIEPLLFDVSPSDPLVFVSVGMLVLAVAVLSSIGPALRAARADPNLALRSE